MNKKRIGKLLFLIVFLITLVIGFSYAFSNWNYIGSTFNKLTSSDLEISLLESETNVISLNNAFPMTDEEGLDTDSFDFAVTSKTVKEEGIRYTISIEKLEADTGYTFLNDSDVKIYLEDYEGNVLLEPTLISNLDNYKLYTGSHVHDSTNNELQDKYKLKVWIDQSKENDAKSWDLDTKIQYKFKLNINNEETNNTFTVNAVANNGTITGNTSVGVVEGGNARFSIAPTDSTSEGIVSCTNNQTGTIKNNTLTVKNVNSNTTCTVTYTPSTTTLYTDGTLIINEKASDREANITTHGAVTNEYAAMSNSNNYVFSGDTSQPWNSQKTSVIRVEIGQKIQPINTQRWFYGLTKMSYGDFTNLDTSQSTSFLRMFYQTGYNSSVTSFELIGLDNWNTSKVTSMNSMFLYLGYYATTWSIGNLSNWYTSHVSNMNQMFMNAGYNATTFDIGDLSSWDTSKVTTMQSMFATAGRSATTWSIGDLSSWDTSKVTTMQSMFNSAGRNATTWSIGNLSNWDTSKVTDMNWMFSYAGYSATTFDIGDLSNWDTSKVTNMSKMFTSAGQNATTWNIGDLSSWDTSKATDMSNMFTSAGYSATTFDIGDLSSWDTSKVTTMNSMFNAAGYNATTWNSIGTLKVYAADITAMFQNGYNAKATLNIINVPTAYSDVFTNAATSSDALITLNYNCTTISVVDSLLATKSSNSNVVRGVNLEGTCPDRTINVTVNNGTVNTSSTIVPNLGSATFNLTPTSGYSNPLVSCTNGQNGSMSGNTLTVSNVVSNTTCTVTYYISEAINLTENDATYPWIETSGVWKSGNYNVNSTTSTITSESFTLTNGGTVSFDWAVSSESASYDYLYYTIYKDGVAVSGTGTSTKIGGNGSVVDEANLTYTTVSKELEAGTYTIAFSYRKDGSTHTGLDRGYVKNIFVLK